MSLRWDWELLCLLLRPCSFPFRHTGAMWPFFWHLWHVTSRNLHRSGVWPSFPQRKHCLTLTDFTLWGFGSSALLTLIKVVSFAETLQSESP